MQPEVAAEVGEAAEVVVIGGGPAGSAAALRLARCGRHVVQLERRVFGASSNDALRSGEGLIPRTRRELADLGLDSRRAPWALTQVERVRTRWLDGTRTDDRIGDRGGIVMIDRECFDQHLFAAARTAGVDGRQGWRARALCRDDRGRVRGVIAQGPDDRLHEIRAAVVIDAGGRNALAIRELDLREREPDGDFFAMAMYFDRVAGVQPGVWEMHLFDPAAMTVVQITQLGANLVRCGLGTTMHLKQAAERDPQQFFWRRLHRAPGLVQRLAASRPVQRPWVRAALGFRVRDVVFDGLVLIGDATGYVNPLFGDGIYRALRTAKHAAATIEHALQQGACTRARLTPYARRHAAANCVGWCERHIVRGMYRHSYVVNNVGQMRVVRNALLRGLLGS